MIRAGQKVLGLSMEEFFHLSPACFHALLEACAKGNDPQTIVEAKYADEIGW